MLGYKRGMTQVYLEDKVVPVTVVEVPMNLICKVKTEDSSHVVDLGIGEKKEPTSAEKGKYAKVKMVPRYIWAVTESDEMKEGDSFGPEVFKEGDVMTVTGVAKAKGFAGVIKRWGFKGGKRTRGQSDRERAIGSIGGGTDPGRVLPGKKMPGRMGGHTKTVRNRRVVDIGDDFLLIHGALPGNVGGLLKLTKMNADES